MNEKYDIFISYSRKDSKIVNTFFDLFRAWGYSVWLDKDGIESGDAFISVIVKAILNSKVVVFFSSEHSNNSSWTTKEIALAVEEKKKIIPIKLDSAKYNNSIRFQLIDLDFIDYHADKEVAKDRLKKALASELGVKENVSVIIPQKKNKNIKLYSFVAIFFIAIVIIGLFVFFSKSNQVQDTSSIDIVTQKVCSKILCNKMEEIGSDYGQVIVMECSTGKIRAMVEIKGNKNEGDSTNLNYKESNDFDFKSESLMMRYVSMIACLEKEYVDTNLVVDTGVGVWPINEIEVRDHNWERGGYGELTFKEGWAFGSNVFPCRLVKEAYGGKTIKLYNEIEKMGYGLPNSLSFMKFVGKVEFEYPDNPWSWLGYNQKITPIQLLAFFNSFANNGVMIEPSNNNLTKPITIRNKVVSGINLRIIQSIMRKCITEGLGRKAGTDEFRNAGVGASTTCVNLGKNANDEYYYILQYYGYFPIEHPRYSIIVNLNKWGLPASAGGMCGPVVKDIAEIIYYNKQ